MHSNVVCAIKQVPDSPLYDFHPSNELFGESKETHVKLTKHRCSSEVIDVYICVAAQFYLGNLII